MDETHVEEELMPDTEGTEQSEDIAIVKYVLKELLMQTKEVGSRLHKIQERSFISAVYGSISHARSAGIMDTNLISPPGVKSEGQYPPGQAFYTDGLGGF